LLAEREKELKIAKRKNTAKVWEKFGDFERQWRWTHWSPFVNYLEKAYAADEEKRKRLFEEINKRWKE
jgi:hypothetical protein